MPSLRSLSPLAFSSFPAAFETVDYFLHPEALPESSVFLTTWHCLRPPSVDIMFYFYISRFQNQVPYLVPLFVFHTTLKTVICPDHDFNPYVTSGCLTSSPNALFPQPESAHVSTSFAHIFFLKHKPAYLISGYLSALLALSFLPLQSPQSLVSSLHSNSQGDVLPMFQILPKYSISKQVDDGASQAPRMKSNVERGQL